MIDYHNLIDNLEDDKIISLMTSLGVENYIEKENCIIFPTICHNDCADDASLKLYYYKDTKLFYCYTECGAMNIFKFLEHYYETRNIEYNWYIDIYKVIETCSIAKEDAFVVDKYKSISDKYIHEHAAQLPEFNKNILDTFIKYYPVEWLNDNISKQAMDKFNIKYCISQNKIIIPHYDKDNRLIGIRGRALDPWEIENVGKYTPLFYMNKLYNHPLSLNLYGLNITKNNIKKTGYCFLFESEKSVLQCESFNMPNCAVAICGSNFNKFQFDILLRECSPNEIIFCLDNEEKPKENKYFNKLLTLCKKYNMYCDCSFLYDHWHLTKLKDSPSDNGEEIFKKLIERRVKVK